MPPFSANLGFLWAELEFTERIHAAKAAGFKAVECHWPYSSNAQLVKSCLQQTGLTMLGINTQPGDLNQNEFGLAALPGREYDARKAIDQAFDYAATIDAGNVHVMAGLSHDHPEALTTFVDNLVYANNIAERLGVGVLIEPINRIDKPQYALHSMAQATWVLEQVESRIGTNHSIRVMFDCYHVGRSGGDVLSQLKTMLPRIGHIQIAAVPDRHEPDHGDIDYRELIQAIESLGYHGYIGAEYIPADTTSAGLGWYAPYC